MKCSIRISNLEQYKSACIVVGIFASRQLSLIAEQLDMISHGYIRSVLNSGAMQGSIGQTLLLHDVPNIIAKRILLIGCGKKRDIHQENYKKIIYKTIQQLNDAGLINAICFLTEIPVHIKGCNTYWRIRHAIEVTHEAVYSFNQLKSQKTLRKLSLRHVVFTLSVASELKVGTYAMQHGSAIANSIKIAKDISNMPPNICNAAYLDMQARQLAEEHNQRITTYSIGEKEMKEIGMNAYLAVGRGSRNESLMSVIKYTGALNVKTRPIVFIGKGVTFDTGGVSLKPGESMDEMKYDMCGAASVYAAMRVAAELKLPLNIIGIMAGCENMPGGRAYRPGDVLTTLSGQTVEVLNTDAEGRLILCDVLTYVERFQPETVIDIATLTGACVIALGHHISGLFSNHNPLAHELTVAAEQAGDQIWRLPITKQYQQQLDSNVADIANIGGRHAGAITAACFLARFAHKYHWAHLDIAGTAWRSGSEKGATGRPVALLSQFLINRANSVTRSS
ncbi:Cytosol aminopeptidase [Candidatus Erwinia haradaeae]|uniref:Probable cytosol aminopeptidase n=1 Tax=Candidatus Erwinia haradaeae TaxID=1922217 RepID=A0A451DLG8_9GAMM|nr:leucyl aminopeptidase [Candidatus Erwinia haradaeae]VFP87589.1 Cytosol aminopeptidase [Candidatus Erwinia haradaeae]